MICRYAAMPDVPSVTALFRDLCFHIKESSKDVYWDFEEFPLEMGQQMIEGYIHDPEKAVLVAEDQGDVVAMMALEVVGCHLPLSSHQRIGYIAAGYVKEAYRRQGVMKQLEAMSNEFFRSLSIRYVEVNYLPENKGAKEAWNALGYRNFREQARKSID